MIEWIKDPEHFQKIKEKHKDFLVLSFYGEFSSAAKRALGELEQFSKWYKEIPVYVIDVQKVKGVHKQFEVKNVPTVLSLEKGKVTRRMEGVESAQLYAQVLSGAQPSRHKKGEKTISHRVIIYTGAGCPHCAAAKAYLRRKGVGFREVNVSQDQHAAQRLVQHSGQMGVPQIDIDGHIVVGNDKAKIDRLLAS